MKTYRFDSSMSEPSVVIGPPGTGKTTFILNKIEEYLDNDVGIDEIAFGNFNINDYTKILKGSTGLRLKYDTASTTVDFFYWTRA